MAYYQNVVFNEQDFTLFPNVKIMNVIVEMSPKVVLSRAKLARKDGGKVFNRQYGERKITIEGIITAGDREAFLASRGTLMRYTDGIEKTLSIIIGDTPYEYTATVTNTTFSDTGGGYGAFTIDFICSDPFGRDRDAITLIDNVSATTALEEVDYSEVIDGTYKAPIYIMLTVVSVTGATDSYMQVGNQDAEYIKITRDWANDDQVIIDTENKVCTVNGSSVDYAGGFFRVNIDDSALTYADDFSTRDVEILATYKRRYL